MKRSWIVVLALSAACSSDVSLCGGEQVCGVDGRTYDDFCAAGFAGVDVAGIGPCSVNCPPPCEIGCPFGLVRGEDGCFLCECAPGPDAGVADASVDAVVMVRDATMVDAARPDAGCPLGWERCEDGRCVPLDTVDNCGGCGRLCDMAIDSSEVNICVAGECAVECAPGKEDCDDRPGCETSIDTNLSCGACDAACPRLAVCRNVAADFDCECPADAPDACGDRCTDFAEDPANCGRCDRRCGPTETCDDGECTPWPDGEPDCRNPASWTCADGPGGCSVRCGDAEFFVEGLTAECFGGAGIAGATCTLPVGPRNCDTCRNEAAFCCVP
ncbi:MAG: hypothetical protein AAGE52_26110 [Myxococcota bacterium]